MTGPGRVGSRVTHRLQNVGRVGSGQSLCGSGRAGSRKSDPRPTLINRPSSIAYKLTGLLISPSAVGRRLRKFAWAHSIPFLSTCSSCLQVENDPSECRSTTFLLWSRFSTTRPMHYLWVQCKSLHYRSSVNTTNYDFEYHQSFVFLTSTFRLACATS